jgi:hypothetical protein
VLRRNHARRLHGQHAVRYPFLPVLQEHWIIFSALLFFFFFFIIISN